MGIIGGFGKGFAALGAFIPVYGTAIAAIGSIAATLDADSTEGNVALPQLDPWMPYNYLWGTPTAAAWSELITGRRLNGADSFFQPFDTYPKLPIYMGGTVPNLRGALDGTVYGGPDRWYHAVVNEAIRRGSPNRVTNSASIVIRKALTGKERFAWRVDYGRDAVLTRNVLQRWRPPFGGPAQAAAELINRWAERMQAQSVPNFEYYLDNRGWFDSPWNIGTGNQSWQESVPIVSMGYKMSMVPQYSLEEWLQDDPLGLLPSKWAQLESEMATWDADAAAWYDWRNAAKIQVAKDAAKKEIGSAFDSAVQEALDAGLGESGAMQFALDSLAAQIGGVAAPVASPDPIIAETQAQAAYGGAVEELALGTMDESETVPAEQVVARTDEISPTTIAVGAAAGLMAVGLLLSR